MELLIKHMSYIESILQGRLQNIAFRNLFPILLQEPRTKILDFGGELGSNFYSASLVKPGFIEKYAVVENSALVHAMRDLPTGDLRFFTEISSA